ncbi:hypothetical protein DQ04_03191050 [Trypanosoma grayi]|uniref:hypothetical protein n=1 Tax=Trypanosoma grayi TaxID=71804 RepID=UPI0004F41848|nr:hypothetical protein DQ04_03191050 [Trypanosoma grayi]KEG10881.1 hypothetical protein DQ04_03191050 [Trypanosoma grayi]
MASSSTSFEANTLGTVVKCLETTVQQQEELLIRLKVCEERLRELQAHMLQTGASQPLPSPQILDCAVTIEAGNVKSEATVQKLCDYCFKLAPCRPCPECQREWYCSSPCQRLRSYLHHPVCHHRKMTES